MPYIKSNNDHSDHVIVGEDLSLNCSVNMDIGVSYSLHWKVPDENKLQVSHIFHKFTDKIIYSSIV